jgi:hypothetical protein
MVVREWLRSGVDPAEVERVAREAARRLADADASSHAAAETADPDARAAATRSSDPALGADSDSDSESAVGTDTGDTPGAAEETAPIGADAAGADAGKRATVVEPIEADNWLSMPVVVDERYLVKVTSQRNSLVHALFTAGRNLGAFSSGVEGFFEHHDDPAAMARHELAATRAIREAGVAAPRPVAAFEIDGLGVLVSEYLPDPRPLSTLSDDRVRALAPEALSMLARLHAAGLAHGDLQAENLLLSAGELYLIDATNVQDDPQARRNARAYDLASALATFAPRIGARETVDLARREYDDASLLAAREFLPFVALRPDHEFDDARVAGAVDAAVEDASEPATTPGAELTPELAAELRAETDPDSDSPDA